MKIRWDILLLRQPLSIIKVVGRKVAGRRMQALAVVETDDVVGDVGAGFLGFGVVAPPDTLHLQFQEEAFYDGVDPAVGLWLMLL